MTCVLGYPTALMSFMATVRAVVVIYCPETPKMQDNENKMGNIT